MEAALSPLNLVKMMGENILKVAEDSLSGGLLKENETAQMQQAKSESAAMLALLLPTLAKLEGKCRTEADQVSMAVALLLKNALTIGVIQPASTAGAKAAQAAIGTRRARDVRALGARSTAIEEAIERAVGPNWDGKHPSTKAKQIIDTVNKDLREKGIKEITARAVYERIKARQC
jgi:hypothetical protein